MAPRVLQPSVRSVGREVGAAVREWLPELEVLVATLAAVLLVIVLGRRLLVPAITRLVGARNARNPTVVTAVERYSQLLVLLAAVAVGITVAGHGDLLAGSAIVVAAATLALGVAGQEVIGNLVSGLFLVADPEFNVDDWIAWEGGEGVVEAIDFRVTRVRTEDGELLTVPNTVLTTGVVAQPYTRDRVRIDVRIGIDHDEDVERARELLHEAIDAVDDVATDREPLVLVDEIGDDALWLRAQFWIAEPTRRDVRHARSAYLRTLHAGLTDAGVAFSPPDDHAVTGEIDVR